MAATTAAMTRQAAGGVRRFSNRTSVRTAAVAPRQAAVVSTRALRQTLVQQRGLRYSKQDGLVCRSVTEDVGASTDDEVDVSTEGLAERPNLAAAPVKAEKKVEEEAAVPVAEADAKEAPAKAGKSGKGQKQKRQFPEPGPVITEVPFKAGDVVQGRVLFSNFNGARVEVLCGVKGVIGYMMFNAGPHSVSQEIDEKRIEKNDFGPFRIPKGLVREFKVLNIPDEMRENGVGPLLSAKAVDEDVIWNRLDQMRNACEHDKVNFEVEITGTNKGGIRSRLQGMSLFVPYSFMPKCPEDTRWSEQVAGKLYLKKQVEVSLLDVDRQETRLVGSMNQAKNNKTMKLVYPGALVQGTIRKIEGFGAFVGIDNTQMSALLHVSNVSQGHLDHVSSIFKIGDRVSCIVTEMEKDGTRVSLSMKELEMYKGEMLEEGGREAVMSNAEQRYAEYMEYEGYEY